MRIKIEEVKETYKKRELAAIYKYEYFEHVVEIGALRKLGVRHRIIADLLNKYVKTSTIDRYQTSAMWKKWEALGYITKELQLQIDRYAMSVQADDVDEVKPVQNSASSQQWENL